MSLKEKQDPQRAVGVGLGIWTYETHKALESFTVLLANDLVKRKTEKTSGFQQVRNSIQSRFPIILQSS